MSSLSYRGKFKHVMAAFDDEHVFAFKFKSFNDSYVYEICPCLNLLICDAGR